MTEREEIRKKANHHFRIKIWVNVFLTVLGAFLIFLFLRTMQHQAALKRQEETSQQALNEAVSVLQTNQEDLDELVRIYHDGNQDMVNDLYQLMISGLFDSLTTADVETRSAAMTEMVERSGVDYFFLMDSNAKVIMAPTVDLVGMDLVYRGLLTQENAMSLIRGTRREDGTVEPALENNRYGYYYWYSYPFSFNDRKFVFVLGADASMLDVQTGSLKDVSAVLSHAAVGSNGFMFAVDKKSTSFLYYENDGVSLTGKNALEAGLSMEALNDGYSGIQTIEGVRYHCVSRTYGDNTVICAVADTDNVFADDRYAVFWSVSCFIMVMVLCLAYAVIVRNDFVRNAVQTEKIYLGRDKDNSLIFDRSVFRKVTPLMLAGVFMIYGLTFYTQTLLEISKGIENSALALEEVTARYQQSQVNREVIKNYYNHLFLSKARLIAYLMEEDPSALNEPTERYYSVYENGSRVFLEDDEGNLLRSVGMSRKLQELCDANHLETLYIFDEDGRTIATNTENWYFAISHKEGDQSYDFLQVLDGRKDSLVQDAMVSDVGETAQYVGVEFNYYTTLDEEGNTVYVSRFAYEDDTAGAVTPHRSLLQIGLRGDLSARIFASTETGSILSSDMLSGGFIVLFDGDENNTCLYSPNEGSIGRTAADLGVSPKAFTGLDYYGFTRVNGISYFQYFRYIDGYFIGTAIPRSNMYQLRSTLSLITSLVSLLLILILSGTVTLATKEEEYLFETMSEDEDGLDNPIFSIILPSGRHASTVKASSRWDNKYIPWSDRSPEQKLLMMFSVVGGILVFYVAVSVLGVNHFYSENSIIHYILSNDWDRGLNIFAFSQCVMVLVFTAIFITLFRIPVRIMSQLLGARGETIGHLLLSVVKYGGAIGAIFYCMYLAGMDSVNLLASAGVLSLVIGLGAQSLIKDIIAGIFIVFEGEFRVGDIVTIHNYRGTVMDIGLRTTKIMAHDGNIKIFNNSDISGVLNMTKETSVAYIKISIEYGQDIDYVEAVLKKELPLLKDKNPKILEEPSCLGVADLGESGVNIAVIARCTENDVRSVSRFLNKEVLQIFYRNGINVPFPNVTVSELNTRDRKTMADFTDSSEETEQY